MESIKIREATVADAAIIAQVVAMAIGEESIVKYCGTEYLKALEEAAAVPDTQYSYMNALVAEVDGVAAGAVVGYDGAKLAPLRERTLSIVRKYNKDLTVIDEDIASNPVPTSAQKLHPFPSIRLGHVIGRLIGNL